MPITIPPVIVSDLNSPEAKYAGALLAKYGVQAFGSVVVPTMALVIYANPKITDEQLVSEEDGTLKRQVRHHIGWGVDFVWPFVDQYVDLAVRHAIPEARAAAAAMPKLPTA